MNMNLNEEDWAAGTQNTGTATLSEDFEFDSSESSEESLRSDGFVDREGWYHFEVTKVEFALGLIDEDGKENTPHMLFYCKVLESVQGQSPAGSLLIHRVYVASKGGEPPKQGSIDSMFRFGLGIGHLVWGKNSQGSACPVLKATGTTKIPVKSWAEAVGSQFVASVKKEKNNNPQYADKFVIPMGKCYRPDHADVSHVQKNVEALKLIGITATYNKNDAAGKGQPAAAAKASSSPAGNGGQAAQPAQPQPAGQQRQAEFSIDDY